MYIYEFETICDRDRKKRETFFVQVSVHFLQDLFKHNHFKRINIISENCPVWSPLSCRKEFIYRLITSCQFKLIKSS